MRIMSLPIALQVIGLVTKGSLNLRVASKSVKSLMNSSKYEMDHCIYLIATCQETEYWKCEVDCVM